MERIIRYTPFLAFLGLLVMVAFLSFDTATSVIPGWHTTIYPDDYTGTFIDRYPPVQLILVISLLLLVIAYWLLAKRIDPAHWYWVVLHYVFTLLTVSYILSPHSFFTGSLEGEDAFIAMMERLQWVPYAWGAFWVIQAWFLIYFVRTMRKKKLDKRYF